MTRWIYDGPAGVRKKRNTPFLRALALRISGGKCFPPDFGALKTYFPACPPLWRSVFLFCFSGRSRYCTNQYEDEDLDRISGPLERAQGRVAVVRAATVRCMDSIVLATMRSSLVRSHCIRCITCFLPSRCVAHVQ